MSSWVAAPLAALLMVVIGVVIIVVIWLVGWLKEQVAEWIQGSRVEGILDTIGPIFALALVAFVVVLAWLSLFSWLRG